MPTLRLFGGASLEDDDGDLLCGEAAQRHRIALLALLAATPRALRSRDKLIAYLWPDRDSGPARHCLSVSVHVLRQALGGEALITVGDDIRLNRAVVSSDVQQFAEALERGEAERAVGLYSGGFLDGFFLRHAPEFEQWVQTERDRLADRFAGALEAVAERSAARGDHSAACHWWYRLAQERPDCSRVALRLMQSLEASGDPIGALHHAAVHAARLEREYGMRPDPSVSDLSERLRIRLAVRPVEAG